MEGTHHRTESGKAIGSLLGELLCDKGQHWQVKGPNGCGKSTLLGLIFGDHPQCYSNDIQIFGKQRGSGETIWEIKKHIGMVSSALHLQYRVNCSALEVLLISDEPYQGLDYLGRRLIKNALELIANENLSQLLYVSHYQGDSLASIRNALTFVFDEQANCYKAEIEAL